ncbi:MAG: hypothetical protein GF310_06130 [candidate division Zixibacteria bacterium]|nr:hypothetical protein [candidate division Zixibacteria bacterium]
MSRKIKKVPIYLHPQDSGPLTTEEIKIILRGSDDLIGDGSRNILAKNTKILKESRDKKLLAIYKNLLLPPKPIIPLLST